MTIDLERARDAGEFAAHFAEIQRCIDIYSDPVARERPRRAWAFLPGGWQYQHCIEELAETPVETEPDRGAWHTNNLSLLFCRLFAIERSKASASSVH